MAGDCNDHWIEAFTAVDGDANQASWQDTTSGLVVVPLLDLDGQCLTQIDDDEERQLEEFRFTRLEFQMVPPSAADIVMIEDGQHNLEDLPLLPQQSNPKKQETSPVWCSICNTKVKNEKNLRAHMKTHDGEKKFRCPNCPKTFLRSNQMKSHQRVHTGERPYECDVCFKTFSQSSNFFVHKNTHLKLPLDESLPFRCDICDRTFGQQLYLRSHMKVHTERDPMRCKLCRRKYDRQEDLDKHAQEHVALNVFRCLECGREFERYVNLKNHRFRHNGIKPHACTICGKGFSHTTSLAVHLRTHTGEKPFACELCEQTFSQWANYHRHLATHDKKAAHQCAVCHMTFAKLSSLKSHAKKHGDGAKRTKYICDTCGKGFVQRSIFEKHVKAHLGGCLVCGAEVGGGGDSYAEHMRTMHRNKKVTCDICHGRFASVRDIRQHMDLVHVAPVEPMYKCDECNVSANEFALDGHVRRDHPAYRLHNCPYCWMNFVHIDLLLMHVKEHLGQKQCEQCGKLFDKYGLYKRHQCVRAEYMREIRQRNEEHERRLRLAEGLKGTTVVDSTLATNVQESVEPEITECVYVKSQTCLALEISIDWNDDNVPLKQETNATSLENTSNQSADFEFVLLKEENLVDTEYENMHSNDNSELNPEFPLDDKADLSPNSIVLQDEDDPFSTVQTTSFICAVCGRSFATDKKLTLHTKSHGKHKFHCDQCAMSFMRSHELTTHMRLHTGERPFQCEICSKCFTQSSALYTHHRVHSGDRPFACKICDKRFKQSSARKRHEALHSAGKPCTCRMCPKSFATLDELHDHEQTHAAKPPPKVKVRRTRPPKVIRVKPTKPEPQLGPNGYYGDLPYPCEVCRKTFAKACTLWMHAKIHTGEKNFTCDQCPKAFAQAANLKRHKMSHTGKRPFQCFECTKWFAKQETLDAHMQLHSDAKRQHAVTVIQVQGTSAVATTVIAKNSLLK